MAYDKDSFLSGLAVGRSLHGYLARMDSLGTEGDAFIYCCYPKNGVYAAGQSVRWVFDIVSRRNHRIHVVRKASGREDEDIISGLIKSTYVIDGTKVIEYYHLTSRGSGEGLHESEVSTNSTLESVKLVEGALRPVEGRMDFIFANGEKRGGYCYEPSYCPFTRWGVGFPVNFSTKKATFRIDTVYLGIKSFYEYMYEVID